MPLSPFPCSRCTFPDRKRQKKLSTTSPFHSFFFYFFCVIKQNNLFLRVKRWAQIRLSVRAQGSGSTPLSTDVTRESVHRFGFFPTLTGLTESMINGVKFAVHTEPATSRTINHALSLSVFDMEWGPAWGNGYFCVDVEKWGCHLVSPCHILMSTVDELNQQVKNSTYIHDRVVIHTTPAC